MMPTLDANLSGAAFKLEMEDNRKRLEQLNSLPPLSPKNSDDGKILYYMNIKKKVELLLEKIVKKYGLEPYLSLSLKYRFDESKIYLCPLWKKYKDGVTNDGQRIVFGRDYTPDSFDDWLSAYFSDYYNAKEIYTKVCKTHAIVKSDLILLNKIAKKYIDEPK